MEFVENQVASRSEVLKKKNIEALEKTIRKLHKGSKFVDFVSIVDNARGDEQAIKGKNLRIIEESSEFLNKIEKTGKDNLIRKPCHNYLNPTNILFSNGKFILLDGELAGQKGLFFDLATVFILYAFEKKHDDIFLKTYLGKIPGQGDYDKLQLMKQFAIDIQWICLFGNLTDAGSIESGTHKNSYPSEIIRILQTRKKRSFEDP